MILYLLRSEMRSCKSWTSGNKTMLTSRAPKPSRTPRARSASSSSPTYPSAYRAPTPSPPTCTTASRMRRAFSEPSFKWPFTRTGAPWRRALWTSACTWSTASGSGTIRWSSWAWTCPWACTVIWRRRNCPSNGCRNSMKDPSVRGFKTVLCYVLLIILLPFFGKKYSNIFRLSQSIKIIVWKGLKTKRKLVLYFIVKCFFEIKVLLLDN